jgi:hypothetical protein
MTDPGAEACSPVNVPTHEPFERWTPMRDRE